MQRLYPMLGTLS